jgi:hypothetical protein
MRLWLRGSNLVDQPCDVFAAIANAAPRRPVSDETADCATGLSCRRNIAPRLVDVVEVVHHDRIAGVAAWLLACAAGQRILINQLADRAILARVCGEYLPLVRLHPVADALETAVQLVHAVVHQPVLDRTAHPIEERRERRRRRSAVDVVGIREGLHFRISGVIRMRFYPTRPRDYA